MGYENNFSVCLIKNSFNLIVYCNITISLINHCFYLFNSNHIFYKFELRHLHNKN